MKFGYLLPLMLLASCATSQTSLVGRWDKNLSSSGEYWCFAGDGTMIIGNDTKCNCSQAYNWRIKQDTLILSRGRDELKSEIVITETVLRVTTLFPNKADLISTFRRKKRN
jgi:hypothetical protein